jgi:alpha,alpha-trehalase
MNATELDRQAVDILRRNDRGHYTIPTGGLYPYQWNWDSAFVALGLATFDIDRAWIELESLLGDQWADGMVPHIIFRRVDPSYFPGPDQWGTSNYPPTSGITQPPVAATIARQLYDSGPSSGRERAKELIIRLDRWHDWFASARDPDGRGLVAITHPWESGRDNLPDWDRPLSFVDTSRVGEYQRRDTLHVHADQRPHKDDYDRYLALVQFGRENSWDIAAIADGNPFWVADVGVNAILLRAERDLAALADDVGAPHIAERARHRADRLAAGIEALWSDDAGGYVSLDLRRDEHASSLSAGAFLPLYAGAAPKAHADRLTAALGDWLDKVRYGVPSFDPGDGQFDAIRYWRGPVWAVVNWMIADGLRRYRQDHLAERVRQDTRALVETAGFYESFSPLDGQGCGGRDFSWTAAMWLAWSSPTKSTVAA